MNTETIQDYLLGDDTQVKQGTLSGNLVELAARSVEFCLGDEDQFAAEQVIRWDSLCYAEVLPVEFKGRLREAIIEARLGAFNMEKEN